MKNKILLSAQMIILIFVSCSWCKGQCALHINYDTAGNRVYRGNGCDPTCSLLVTNTNDDGAGSLRKAIACAAEGDTILFSPALIGQFITLTNGAVNVNKSINILQNGISIIKVKADGLGPVLEFVSGQSKLRHTYLFGSNEVGKDGRALINRDDLTLENVHLYDAEHLVGSGSTITNYGNLIIEGNTKLIVQATF